VPVVLESATTCSTHVVKFPAGRVTHDKLLTATTVKKVVFEKHQIALHPEIPGKEGKCQQHQTTRSAIARWITPSASGPHASRPRILTGLRTTSDYVMIAWRMPLQPAKPATFGMSTAFPASHRNAHEGHQPG
jgi:hypothetical protein